MSNYDFSIVNYSTYPTMFFGVNNKGEAVGRCFGTNPISGVYYPGSGPTISGFNAGGETECYGINDEGIFVGRYVEAHGPHIFGFWSPGSSDVITFNPIIGEPGVSETEICGVNKSRTMVGRYTIPFSQPLLYQMFTVQGSNHTKLGAPRSGSVVHAYGINDLGHVVGTYTKPNQLMQAFVYKDGAFKDLTLPGATQSSASGINNHGHIVGWYEKQGQQRHAFVLSDSELKNVEPPPDASNVVVNGINDAGVIVGGFTFQNADNGFIARPTSGQSTFTTLVLKAEMRV